MIVINDGDEDSSTDDDNGTDHNSIHLLPHLTLLCSPLSLSSSISIYAFIFQAFPKSKIHISLYGPNDFSFEEQGLHARPLLPEDPVGVYIGSLSH